MLANRVRRSRLSHRGLGTYSSDPKNARPFSKTGMPDLSDRRAYRSSGFDVGGGRAGQAKVAKGHNPATRYVIHTVGPIWNRGEVDSGIHRLSGQFIGMVSDRAGPYCRIGDCPQRMETVFRHRRLNAIAMSYRLK